MIMNTKENTTIKNGELTFNLINSLNDIDIFEALRFEAQEKSAGYLKLLRQQYSTLQLGNTKKLNAGEMPFSMAMDAIKRLWDSKPRGENKFEYFRDHQVRQLRHLLETGEFYTRKKESVQEKLAVDIDKLEKKAAAEAAKAKKAAEAEAKAAEAKAKAEAKAEAAKAKAEAEAAKAEAAADNIETEAEAEAFLDTLAEAEAKAEEAAEAKEAEAKAAEAAKIAEAEAKAAKAEAAKTAAKLEAAKAKAEALARGKSDSTKQSDPKLDFKTTNFSKDCKDTAQMLLTDLEKDCSAAELLYLAKLIIDKYNK